MSTLTLPQAAPRFGDFHVPRFEIRARGTSVHASVLRDVLQVTYNDSTTEIDSFEVTINNWDAARRRFKYVGSEETTRSTEPLHALFEPCAREFDLSLGYGSELVPVVTGSPTSLEPSFLAGGAPTLTVRALNVLFKLRTKQHRGHWIDKTISEIAEDLGRRNEPDGCRRFPLPIRLPAQSVRRHEPRLPYVAQDNQYDIDFLLLEARKIGYVVYVDAEPQREGGVREVLHFGPSDARRPGLPEARYELAWGRSLIAFTPKLSTTEQARSVEVRGWNRQTNRPIRKKVAASHPSIRTNRDLLHFVEAGGRCRPGGCGPREEVKVDEPVFTPEQAERRAVALMEEKLGRLVEAEGTSIGLPDLRAGQRVRIVGLGARFSGTYFVVKSTHTLDDAGYVTKFTARRESGEGAR